jgi:ATP-dependent DNA helicase PIF1
LTTIHRQSDPVFVGMLQKLRLGRPLSDAEKKRLLKHKSETTNAVQLFACREKVKRINDEAFNRLTSTARSYACQDHYRLNEKDSKNGVEFTRDGNILLEIEKVSSTKILMFT